MLKLGNQLELERCPHCNVDKPSLEKQWNLQTSAYDGTYKRNWFVFKCARCGGLITTASDNSDNIATEIYPPGINIDDSVPEPAKEYLKQAMNSLHAPAGAIMLAASSVDAMLKEKGYDDGSLNKRINQAAKDHLITSDMASWAHEVRLDANEQRHADDGAPLPDSKDAQRCVDFVVALGTFLFVLPARVKRGIKAAKESSEEAETSSASDH